MTRRLPSALIFAFLLALLGGQGLGVWHLTEHEIAGETIEECSLCDLGSHFCAPLPCVSAVFLSLNITTTVAKETQSLLSVRPSLFHIRAPPRWV